MGPSIREPEDQPNVAKRPFAANAGLKKMVASGATADIRTRHGLARNNASDQSDCDLAIQVNPSIFHGFRPPFSLSLGCTYNRLSPWGACAMTQADGICNYTNNHIFCRTL